MIIGVLALQGAFTEHEKMLRQIGVECFQIRQLSDLDGGIDGLVLPGGESTVMSRLLRDLGLYEPLKNAILDGMPVLATCAGAILLAQEVDEKIVAAEYGSQTVLSFHPELTEDKRIHEYFAKRVQAFCSR